MLLLHGGPAATHEYLEAFDSYFRLRDSSTTTTISWVLLQRPARRARLWELAAIRGEVEQVRAALGLNQENSICTDIRGEAYSRLSTR